MRELWTVIKPSVDTGRSRSQHGALSGADRAEARGKAGSEVMCMGRLGVSTMPKAAVACRRVLGLWSMAPFVIMRVLWKKGNVTGLCGVESESDAVKDLPGYWSWRNVSHLDVWIGRQWCGGAVSVGGGSEGPNFLMVPTHENRSRCQPGFLWTLLQVSEDFHHFRSLRRRQY
jgi:hypothetical protein